MGLAYFTQHCPARQGLTQLDVQVRDSLGKNGVRVR